MINLMFIMPGDQAAVMAYDVQGADIPVPPDAVAVSVWLGAR
jgi:hypothetical protein